LLDIDLNGIVDLTRRVGARMIERGRGGKIHMIGSFVVQIGVTNVSVYAATRDPRGSDEGLGAGRAEQDIQAKCIIPGLILTDLNRAMWESEDLRGWVRTAQADPRLGSPEEIAPPAVFLTGHASDYITGQLIAVDGAKRPLRRGLSEAIQQRGRRDHDHSRRSDPDHGRLGIHRLYLARLLLDEGGTRSTSTLGRRLGRSKR
jgi:hypothetical protein